MMTEWKRHPHKENHQKPPRETRHHLLENELLREEGYSDEEDEGEEEEKEKEKESDCFLICWFFSLSVKHLRGTPLLRRMIM